VIHDTPCRTQGRPRCEETTKAILAATRKLFERSNLRDMTIEAIAREAGVGKATIYRWWKTKNELVLDACFEDLQPRLDYGTTGSPACIIAEQVKRVVEAYRGPSGRMVAQLLAEAQYDPAVSRSFTEAYLSRRCCTLHSARPVRHHLRSRTGCGGGTNLQPDLFPPDHGECPTGRGLCQKRPVLCHSTPERRPTGQGPRLLITGSRFRACSRHGATAHAPPSGR